MANDATTQIPQGSHEADMAAGAQDGDYAAVQVAEATPAAAPSPSTPADGKTVQVQIPQGGTVVRVPVQAGETVVLPPPFDTHHDLAAKEGNGNLAIKVGDVTVILQGYIDAANDPQHPVTIDGSDGQPIDIAVVLASTDPNLDIQTAAGPAAGAQGADNTGAILAALAGGPGLGGLTAVGVLDQTSLQYKLIDNSIRQEHGLQPNTPAGPLTLTVVGPQQPLHQSFLHDPVVTKADFGSNLSFDSFKNGWQGHAGFDNSWADFDGTQATPGAENEHATGTIFADPGNGSTVTVSLTTTALQALHLTSDGIALQYEVSADGRTVFGFRGDGTGGSDGALVLVVHVGDPSQGAGTIQEYPVEYYLVNRLDDTSNGGQQIDLTVSFDVTTSDERTAAGTISETILDDNPIAASDSYDVKNHDGITVNVADGVEHNDNFGADGKLGSVLGTAGTGGVVGVEAGDTKSTSTDLHSTTGVHGQFGTLHLNADGSFTYTRDDTGPTKGSETDTFTYTIEDDDGDLSSTTLTVNINDHGVIIVPPPPPGGGDDPIKLNADGTAVFEAALSTGSDPASNAETTSGKVTITAPDGIGSATIKDANGVDHTVSVGEVVAGKHGDLTVTGWNSTTGEIDYSYTLKDAESVSGPGNNVDLGGENFQVTATDTDGDSSSGNIVIAIVDDVPTAHDDSVDVKNQSGYTSGINVETNDVFGADGKAAGGGVVGVAAGVTNADSTANVGTDVHGQYGTLHLNADGTFTYTRDSDAPTNGDEVDKFTYTIKDGDGDLSHAVLTVNINDHGVIVVPPPPPGGGDDPITLNSSGTAVFEAALSTGSDPASNAETTSGKVMITAPDGIASATIKDANGVDHAVSVGEVVAGKHGDLTVTGWNSTTGEIDYSYTLKDAESVSGPGNNVDLTGENFQVTATDTDGDSSNGNIVIAIVDDVPTAVADADRVDYKAGSATSGNVITGVADAGNTDASLKADVSGADGPAKLVGVENAAHTQGTQNGNSFTVTGTYGTLVIDAQGHYTYTLNKDMPQGKTDVFTYTIQDADGDTSATTLTIDTVTKPDITQETPGSHPGEVDVYEAGLAIGSHPGDAGSPVVASGTFLVDSHGEGFQSLTVGGKDISLTNFTSAVNIVDDATGTLKVTGVTDKGNGAYEITYEYDLKSPIDSTPDGNNGNNSNTLPPVSIVATDASGDQADSSLTVKIVDDIPTAKIDTDTVNVASGSTTSGNVVTGQGDADSHLQADTSGADRFSASGDASGGQAHVTNISSTAGGSVAVPGTGNTVSIVGDHGTLVIDDHGNYTYTVGKDPLKQGETDTFTYTIVDADGDTSTTTLTIDVNCPTITQNDPSAHPGVVDVYEAGLPAGSKDGPTDTVANGSFTIDSHGEGFSSLTVGGQQVSLDNFKAVTIDDAHGSMEITGVQTDGKGAYTLTYQYTLSSNIIDNTPNSDGHNTVTGPTYSIVATDKSGDQATSSITVDVVDDIPIAKDSTKSITATGGNYNLLLTIDLSNSMNDSSGVQKADGTGTYTKLELEKAAIADLLATYQAQGDVAVHVTWFNDPQSGGPNGSGDASNPGYGSNDGGWMTVSEAIAYVNGLVAQGNTNYDVAINEAEKSFDDKTGYIAGGTNVAYFFSDGMPNENSGPGSDGKDGVSGNQQTAWEQFLTTNDVNAYAIGVGGAAVASALTPIAYDGSNGTDPAGNTIVVTNLDQLSSVINQTVPTGTAGNLIGDVGGTYGADGAGHVNSFSVDGGAMQVYDSKAADHTVTVTLAEGTFVLDMDSGAYTYTPKAGVEQGSVDITFNIMDGDGDISNTATLHLVPTNHAPVISTNGAGDSAAISVVEGAKIVTTVHAVDVDVNSSVAYSITGGADASKFTIDKSTGVLTFLTGHTTSNPQDAGQNNVYDVVVTATDNKGGTDSQAIAVSVEAAAVANADHIYTNSSNSVTVLDQFLLGNDTDKDTAHDALKVTNTVPSAGQNDYFDSYPTHGDDTHGGGWTTFNIDTSKSFNGDGYLTSGQSTGFDYQVNDGAGNSAPGHVAVTYVAGTTIDASKDTTNDILIGTSSSETFKGGSGHDVIVTNGGNDKVDGGAGFDQVSLSGNQTWSSNYTNVEMANLHDGQAGKLTINAADVFQQTAGTVGGKDVDLFVIGDHDGATKDSVSLNGFSGSAVATSVTFTDPGTSNAHTYDLYQGTGAHTNVIVAVEHDLTVTVTP